MSLLIDQQEAALESELAKQQKKLDKLAELRRELKSVDSFCVESIGDIAHQMENKKNLKKLHTSLVIVGIPISVLQWVSIILWITRGIWWLFPIWAVIAAVFSVWLAKYYFHRVDYICPKCHTVFKPNTREAFFANHTPKTRKLTCPACAHKGFCVEIYGGKES